MLTNKKPLAEKFLEPVVKHMAHVSPNLLTLIGSIPSLLFFVCVVNGWYLAAIIAFIASGFDMLDGMVARKFGKASKFGGFLDSTMDRVADFFIITAFAFAGIVRWEIVAPLLLFAYLTSYARSRGELANPNVSFAIGIVERTERLLGIIAALILYMLFQMTNVYGFNIAEIMFLVLTVLSAITVYQRIMHAYRKL